MYYTGANIDSDARRDAQLWGARGKTWEFYFKSIWIFF